MYQARNNARVLVSGSLDLFSNRYVVISVAFSFRIFFSLINIKLALQIIWISCTEGWKLTKVSGIWHHVYFFTFLAFSYDATEYPWTIADCFHISGSKKLHLNSKNLYIPMFTFGSFDDPNQVQDVILLILILCRHYIMYLLTSYMSPVTGTWIPFLYFTRHT